MFASTWLEASRENWMELLICSYPHNWIGEEALLPENFAPSALQLILTVGLDCHIGGGISHASQALLLAVKS